LCFRVRVRVLTAIIPQCVILSIIALCSVDVLQVEVLAGAMATRRYSSQIYIQTHIYIYIYVYIYVCLYTYVYAHVHCMHAYTHTHTRTRMKLCTYSSIPPFLSLSLSLSSYVSTHIYIYDIISVIYQYVDSYSQDVPPSLHPHPLHLSRSLSC